MTVAARRAAWERPAVTLTRLAVTVAAGLVAAACTTATPTAGGSPSPAPASPPSSTSASAPAGTGALSCPDSVTSQAVPSEAYRIVGDAVAVPDADVLQAERIRGASGPTALFAKWGLLIRTGTSAELSLPAGWADRARIGWGKPGDPTTRLTVTACPATGDGPAWSVFTGGTWVSTPACVPLLIETGGRETRVDVAVGAPCRS